MPKPPKKQAAKERYIRLGLRWEFLRRNKKYIDDYNRYVKECEKKFKDVSLPYPKYLGYIDNLSLIFTKNYAIALPLDPSISFFELKKAVGIPVSQTKIENDWKEVNKFCSKFNRKNNSSRRSLLRPGEKKLYRHSYCALAPEIPYFLNKRYTALLLEFIIRNFMRQHSMEIPREKKDTITIGNRFAWHFLTNGSHPDEKRGETLPPINFSAPWDIILSDLKVWYKELKPKKEVKFRLVEYKAKKKETSEKYWQGLLKIYDYKKLLEQDGLKEEDKDLWEKLTKKFRKNKLWDRHCKDNVTGQHKVKNITRELKRVVGRCKRYIGGDYSQIW